MIAVGCNRGAQAGPQVLRPQQAWQTQSGMEMHRQVDRGRPAQDQAVHHRLMAVPGHQHPVPFLAEGQQHRQDAGAGPVHQEMSLRRPKEGRRLACRLPDDPLRVLEVIQSGQFRQVKKEGRFSEQVAPGCPGRPALMVAGRVETQVALPGVRC